MVNELSIAIAQRLAAFKGKSYIDHLPQGFEEPCFFILPLTISQKQIRGDRYLCTYNFNVRYYPEAVQAARELGDIADKLWLTLEYISLSDGDVRGVEMRSEVHDDVLHFFVQYDVFMVKQRDRGAYMQTLEQNQKIKE